MTEELKSAIEYAESGWMYCRCPDGNTDCKVARVLAEAYLALHDETPVELEEIVALTRRMFYEPPKCTAGHLRMMEEMIATAPTGEGGLPRDRQPLVR